MARTPAQQIAKLNRQLAKLEAREEVAKLRKKVADKKISLSKKGL